MLWGIEVVRSFYSHSSVEIFRSYVKLGVNFFAPILSEEVENRHQRDLLYLGFLQRTCPGPAPLLSGPAPLPPGPTFKFHTGVEIFCLYYFHTRDEKLEDKYLL